MTEYPKWATPERRAHLVGLFQRSGGGCVRGYRPPEVIYSHLLRSGFFALKLADILQGDSSKAVCCRCSLLYENYSDSTIAYWVADDRAERCALWRREQWLMHRVPEKGRWKRRFDPVERERFLLAQPPYYLEGVGVSGLTFSRIAKVRISSTIVSLFLDVARSKLSKNQQRKARRYGRRLERKTIDDLCSRAVQDFWDTL